MRFSLADKTGPLALAEAIPKAQRRAVIATRVRPNCFATSSSGAVVMVKDSVADAPH